MAAKAVRPENPPKDSTVHLHLYFRGVNDVEIDLFGIPLQPSGTPPPGLCTTRIPSMVKFEERECESMGDVIEFANFVSEPNYVELARVACLMCLRFPRNCMGLTTALKWRMRHCDRHPNMVSHELRGFTWMEAIAVGTGKAMKFWEKQLIVNIQKSKLGRRLENHEQYRAGPVRDTDRVWLYIVSPR